MSTSSAVTGRLGDRPKSDAEQRRQGKNKTSRYAYTPSEMYHLHEKARECQPEVAAMMAARKVSSKR